MANCEQIYREYITCLNSRDLDNLKHFVHDDVCYNGNQIGISGYQKMLEKNFDEIPDLYFTIQLLISDAVNVASRLNFNCTPRENFLDLPVSGKKVAFSEKMYSTSFVRIRLNKYGQL